MQVPHREENLESLLDHSDQSLGEDLPHGPLASFCQPHAVFPHTLGTYACGEEGRYPALLTVPGSIRDCRSLNLAAFIRLS